jgi:hypothetical protein
MNPLVVSQEISVGWSGGEEREGTKDAGMDDEVQSMTRDLLRGEGS